MKTVIRTTLSVGLNTVVIRERECEQITAEDKKWCLDVYLNDAYIECKWKSDSQVRLARVDLIDKYTTILNALAV